MINSYFTHQTGLDHIDDLRREADRRRLVTLARGRRDGSRPMARREHRLRLTLGALRTRRAAAA
jgi:hypothetical protein